MPIKGLSEFRRLPRIGKIHLGHKDPTRGFPVKDDFFVFPKEPADAMTAVRRVLAAEHLRLVGLHSHIGSQIFDVEGFELAATRDDEAAAPGLPTPGSALAGRE